MAKEHQQQLRRTIQKAAINLATIHGFDGFTMKDLAQEVGISRSSLFNYTKDKVSAVLGTEDQTLDALIQQVWQTTPPVPSPYEDGVHLINEVLTHVIPTVEETQLITDSFALAQQEPKLMRALSQRQESTRAFLAQTVGQRHPHLSSEEARLLGNTLALLLDEAIQRSLIDRRSSLSTTFLLVVADYNRLIER
ncbi:MAG: TetR/AcrR family transcriptional regulator [Rothia sp. (in: high G+C Gram-positive bacteria)]|nr:TetR/AcrR family transcriptional regulator [Rothia sp. (in: high G+C Gram-positive bacteria)]